VGCSVIFERAQALQNGIAHMRVLANSAKDDWMIKLSLRKGRIQWLIVMNELLDSFHTNMTNLVMEEAELTLGRIKI